MRLKRGHTLLIGGGAIVAVSLVVFTYSTIVFATNLMERNRYAIEPNGLLAIKRFLTSQNASEGAYIIAFPESAIQLDLKITSPSNMTVLEKKDIVLSPTDPPIFERFQLSESGDYTLTLVNPSDDRTIDISAVLGDNQSIIEGGFSFVTLALTFTSLFLIGIAVIIAGIVIIILDRRRISKMKQFGDTSDLV